jgi:alanine racemase
VPQSHPPSPQVITDSTTRHGGILTVDLDAIADNYRSLAARAGPATCAAVVKADAYGLGVDRVAPCLAAAGCHKFFVAHVNEGIALRGILGPRAWISVLHGAPAGAEAALVAEDLIPVLNEDGQVQAWRALARRMGRRLPAILQIDTGMARFGFGELDLRRIANAPDALDGVDLRLVMSHLACADEPDSAANPAQRAAFASARRLFPGIAGSLAASSGIFLGPAFHADLVRPGAALYGIAPRPNELNPMRPVVRLQGQVMQIRSVAAGTPVGYGHVGALARDGRLATVGVGYADGFPRSASGQSAAWYEGHRLPVVGRVSMDSLIVDVSAVPPEVLGPGGLVDLICPEQDLDAVAHAAGTIGYEILTRLGHRFHRRYDGA